MDFVTCLVDIDYQPSAWTDLANLPDNTIPHDELFRATIGVYRPIKETEFFTDAVNTLDGRDEVK